LGKWETADSLEDVFLAQLTGIPPGTRFNLEANRASAEGDIEGAYNWTRRAIDAGSRDHTAWLSLAIYCLQLNRPAEALAALAEMRKSLPEETGAQANFYSYLAAAHHMLGHFPTELEAARALEGLAPPAGRYSPYAVGRAAAALGAADDVRATLDRLEASSDSTGLAGWMMVAVALEQRIHGSGADAEEAITRAVQWFETRRDPMESNAWLDVLYGSALYYAGRWQDAERVLREVEDPLSRGVVVLGHLGLSAARLGEEDRAADCDSRLTELESAPGLNGAAASSFRARIAAVLGDEDEAVRHLKRAFDAGLGYQPAPFLGKQYRFDFEGMADYGPYRELLRPRE
jgi:tetratricopeptide (TPR) repeat protein